MVYPAKLRLAMLVLLLWTVAMTSARTLPSRSKQVKVYSYVLPAGAEEIRDDINHSFACGNRSDGFYVDIDNDCQIFHRCQDKARFSFICAERTVFSQMYQTCVHDGQLGYPCEDSAQYYPEGEGYEPTGAESEPAKQTFQPEQQPDASPQEQEGTPQAPSKSSEISKPQTTGVQDDVPMTDTMQNAVRPPMVVTDDEYRPADQPAYQQVSADLFDSVEEEDSDVPSENSAQEIMDEPEPAAAGSLDTEEGPGSVQTTSGEDTQEVEVMDDPTPQVPTLVSEPSTVPMDVTANVEVESSPADDTNITDGVESTPYEAEVSPPGVPHLAAASLLNAVQTVEELEPIVHDLGVEENEKVPPQLSTADGQAEIAMPTSDAAVEHNEVLPEMGTPVANMVAAPTADTIGEHVIPVAILFDSDVVSSEKVSDLSPEPLSSAEKIGESSEPEAVVSGDELIPVFTPPEVADVKPEVVHGSELPVNNAEEMSANDLKAPQLPERPLESPAIAEEMLPQRSHGDLPELIVSTEFHLDSVTKRAPIRRRKTFLFRADAIRAK
ncbi:protein P200 [Anopheles bellator]|uniref:protein P200 n=1 Tax=Anopheles bellator TaxID=139047 RepID=UPI002649C87F|nr:protein P200 [Anopheles bellator]